MNPAIADDDNAEHPATAERRDVERRAAKPDRPHGQRRIAGLPERAQHAIVEGLRLAPEHQARHQREPQQQYDQHQPADEKRQLHPFARARSQIRPKPFADTPYACSGRLQPDSRGLRPSFAGPANQASAKATAVQPKPWRRRNRTRRQ